MIAHRLNKLERLIASTTKSSDHADALSSPAMFRQFVLVETSAGPRVLADALDDWQRVDFEALDAAWLKAAGFKTESTTKNRVYLERPRGHSKTSDLSIMVSWALAAARKPISGVAAAADRDQGRLLRDAVARLVRLNPWLADHLDVQSHRIVGKQTGAILEIISSDAPSSYGLTPSFVVCDELTHWPENAGGALWDSLFSSAAKVSDCLLIVISNAGTDLDGWVWRVREHARTDADWMFSRLDGPRASWLSQKVLAEQQRLLPPQVYDRLWNNIWQSGSGNAISVNDIQAALRFDDKPSSVEPGAVCFAGVDLATSRDTAAVVIVAREANGCRVSLVDVLEWTPTPGRRIQISDIEQAIIAAHAKYNLHQVAVDAWNAALLVERLGAAGVSVAEVPATAANLRQMADATLSHFAEETIALWPHEGLVRDLRALQLVERGSSWRLESPRDSNGHGDRASALALSLLVARSKPVSSGIMIVDRADVPSFSSFFSQAEREQLGIGAN